MRITTHTVHKGKLCSNRSMIICASLFRMKHGYRGFKKYHDRAIDFIKLTKQLMPNWIVRIYVDGSLTHAEVKELAADHVEIILYHCDDFWDSDSKTHEGVFGTFMRLMPMFSAQKYDIMISSDIDIYPFHLNAFNYLVNKFDDIGLLNTSCHSRWIPPNSKYSILAGGIVSRIVFPRSLLIKYLENIRDEKIILTPVKKTDIDTSLPYGADEYFLNTILSHYINSNNIRVLSFRLSTVTTAINQLVKPITDENVLSKLEVPLRTIRYLDGKLWSNPRELSDTAFVPHLKKIIPYIKVSLEDSRYAQCINEYLVKPKIINILKFNYNEKSK